MLGLASYGENYFCTDTSAAVCCTVVQVDCEMWDVTPVFLFMLFAVPWWFKESGNILDAMNAMVPKGLDGAHVGMCTVSG